MDTTPDDKATAADVQRRTCECCRLTFTSVALLRLHLRVQQLKVADQLARLGAA